MIANNHISTTAAGHQTAIKIVAINYEDAIMLILTSRDSLGTMAIVERSGEGEKETEIDLELLTGAGDRAEAHMNLARMVAEILLFGQWTGTRREKWLRMSRSKKIVISVCLDKEEGAEEDEILRKETIKNLISSMKSMLSENSSFFFD